MNRIIESEMDANEYKGHTSRRKKIIDAKRNLDDELLPTEMQLAFICVDKRNSLVSKRSKNAKAKAKTSRSFRDS